MKRIFVVLFSFIMILFPVNAEAIEISAKSAVVVDVLTGRVLYEKNAYEKLPMASITKIVTAITALERGDITDVVTVSQKADNVEGSSMWLSAGEKMSLEDLLYGLMLVSGNDAAIAIAEHLGGSVEEFAEMMNQTAKKAGALHSNFMNPNGLDQEGHYTTAYDMGLITVYALKNPLFAEIVQTKTKKVPWEGHQWDRTLSNHNRLLNMYEGCDGVKTGFTKKSGRCLVSSATKNGWQAVAVTINAPNDWQDHTKMLDYAFDTYKRQDFHSDGDFAGDIFVKHGLSPRVECYLKGDIAVSLKPGEEAKFQVEYNIPGYIEAPVYMDQKIGECILKYNEREIGRYSILAKDEVLRDNKADETIFTNFIKVVKCWIGIFGE